MDTIIYGAGTYGTLTLKLLKKRGTLVSCFADRKRSGRMLEGMEVITPEEIPEGFEGEVYIAAKNYYSEMYDFLLGRECKNIKSFLEFEGDDVKGIDLTNAEMDAWQMRKSFFIIIKMYSMQGLKINHVEAVVTERCTLRCKDCSSLMPYYKEPKDTDLNKLEKLIFRLLDSIEYLGEVRILGGEPFLNGKLAAFIRSLSQSPKIGLISIYTNGTVVPQEDILNAIKECGVQLHISDYGIGKEARDRFIEKCREKGIYTAVRFYDSWRQFGALVPSNMSDQAVRQIFLNCATASCLTILNGRLYQCPRAAHADAIGIITSEDDETVYLNRELPDIETLKRLLERREPVRACYYCFGSNGKEIPAAVQVGV